MADQTSTIPKGWKMTTLGQVSEKIAMGPFGSNIKVETFVDKGVPVISGTHLNGLKLEDKEYNFITEEHAQKLKSSNVFPGDIIFTHAGNIGQVAYIPDNAKYKKYVLSQRQFFLRSKKEELQHEYLTYFFKTREGQHKLLANANQTGVPSIAQPASYLKSISIFLPPLSEQRAIVAVLSSLDDKIELSREQNKTMEATAQAIFKEWFVNFNFPGATGKMIHSELGEIPERWKVGRLEEIVRNKKNSIVDGPFGTQMKIEEYQGSGVPVIEMDYLGDTFITKSFRHFLSNEKFEEVKRSCANAGDIIISKTGTLGLLGILPDDFDKAIIVSRIAKITPSKELNNRLFIYQFLTYLQSKKYWNRISSGSTMPTFNLTHIKDVKVVVPSGDLYSKFESVFSPVYKKILNNQLQLQTLSTLRDTILPKLMKGEIRVKSEKLKVKSL